jgi:hypothetical protein
MGEDAQLFAADSDGGPLNAHSPQAEADNLLISAVITYPTCPRCGQEFRPGELACARCGLVFQDRLKTKPRDEDDTTLRKCHNCGTPYLLGALGCAHCGAILNAQVSLLLSEDTHDFSEDLADITTNSLPPIGAAPFEPTTIVFNIEGEDLLVPVMETVIVGRMHGWDGQHPIVDLSPFGAYEKGVSRRHLQIRRKGTLIYVADIGSSNGTWLNGRRLLANGERLLRNDDELKLSLLKLRVRYYPRNT